MKSIQVRGLLSKVQEMVRLTKEGAPFVVDFMCHSEGTCHRVDLSQIEAVYDLVKGGVSITFHEEIK